MTTKRRVPVKRAGRGGARDAFSTALLLPGIHPWLKEYLAEENLVPTTDEATLRLPTWGDLPFPTTSIATLLVLAQEQPEALAAIRVQERLAAAAKKDGAPRSTLPGATSAMTRGGSSASPADVAQHPAAVPFRITQRTPAKPTPVSPREVLDTQIPRVLGTCSAISVSPTTPARPGLHDGRARQFHAAAPLPPVHSVTKFLTGPQHDEKKVAAPREHSVATAHLSARIPAPAALATSHGTANQSRPSLAPTPFRIPVDASMHTATASPQNMLRIVRSAPAPQPHRTTPDFITALQASATSAHTQARTAIQRTGTQARSRLALRAQGPAPWPAMPAPYNELLMVTCIMAPLELCWRAFGWQVWSFLRALLPTPAITGFGDVQWNGTRIAGHAPLLDTLQLVQTRVRTLRTLRLPSLAFVPHPAALAHAAGFAGVLLAVLLPLKLLGWGGQAIPAAHGRVLGATASARDAFRAGGGALAAASFVDAVEAFEQARAVVESLPSAVGPIPALALRAARTLPVLRTSVIGRAAAARDAGIALADASGAATRGLALLAAIDPSDDAAGPYFHAARASFATAHARARTAEQLLGIAAPASAAAVSRANDALAQADALLAVIEALGGFDRSRRILLAFQNPAELRPTGGFIGSVALLDVHNGAMRALNVPGGGSYDISGMTRMRVQPPEPLLLVADTWQFHDANWFPDFPTSARQLRSFYEQSNGSSVDAVVAINAPFLERALELTGPVTVHGQTYSAADVLATLTNTVESSAARATGAPKAVIADLAPVVLQRLLALATGRSEGSHGAPALADLLLQALNERDLLLAFTDDAVQRRIGAARWDGAIVPTDGDALAVFHANIGGGKSDAVVQKTIHHDARITADGRLVDTVSIMLNHTGTAPPAGATPLQRLLAKQHVDYLRAYVPRGAVLLRASGFELPPGDAFRDPAPDAVPDERLAAVELNAAIDTTAPVRITEEFGRTTFGGWVLTPPGAQRTVTLTYELPWHYDRARAGTLGRTNAAPPQPYSLLVQKQPGATTSLTHTLTLDPTWRAAWTTENLTAKNAGAWTLVDDLRTDVYTGAMIAPQ
ncbi:MAG: DUF4012 domain-containing protein [bacterium]|nr:DUF4012 domain-containing protein [bacterium]